MNRVRHIAQHLSVSNSSSLSPHASSNLEGIPDLYGGALVADILRHEGVDTVFTLTGGHIAPILVGCNQSGIRVVDVRDEVTTVFAADAVSRVTGIPGVAIVTAGPGLTNTITAVKNAQMAESAVIVMGGATSMLLKGRGSLQDIDQFALMRPHTKACFTIKRVKDIIPTLERAFFLSKTGVPGPVFIEFPLETIWPESMIRQQTQSGEPAPFSLTMNGLLAYMADKYVSFHLNKVFSGAFDNTRNLLSNSKARFAHSSHYISDFSPISIKSVLNFLNSDSIQKPLFVLGSQSVLHVHLIPQLVEALELLNVPTYLSGMARGLLGESHKLHKRHKRGIALKNCDFVLLCGVSCDFRLDYGRGINKRAKFVMINLDENKLSNNTDLRRRDLTVCGDSLAFILRLAETAKKFGLKFEFKEWERFLNTNEAKRESEIDRMRRIRPKPLKSITSSETAQTAQNGPNSSKSSKNDVKNEVKSVRKDKNNISSGLKSIRTFCDPIFVCRVINEVIAQDSFLIADGGDFVGTASYIVRPRRPLRWLDPGAFGTLGCGAGFAMGVKSQNPNSEVWCLYGDGSFGWSMSEFDTLKRNKLPVIAVIGNDACWQQMYRDQIKMLKDPVATLLEYSNYQKCVEGFGCKGLLVENEEQLKPALMEAKKLAREGHPVVVNVLLAKSSFREGSISL